MMLSMALGLDPIWHNMGLAHKGQQKLGLGRILIMRAEIPYDAKA